MTKLLETTLKNTMAFYDEKERVEIISEGSVLDAENGPDGPKLYRLHTLTFRVSPALLDAWNRVAREPWIANYESKEDWKTACKQCEIDREELRKHICGLLGIPTDATIKRIHAELFAAAYIRKADPETGADIDKERGTV